MKSLASVPRDDRPPDDNVVRYAFQIMVGVGSALLVLTAWFLGSWWRRRRMPRSQWFYRLVILAGPAAICALISGWIVTEVGRQPWIVYGIMRTTSAVTDAGGVQAGFVGIMLVYVLLAGAVVWLLRRLSRHPLEHDLAGSPAGVTAREAG